MVDPSRVRVSGPLKPLAAGFAAELNRQGYARASQYGQLQLMAHLSRWLAARQCDLGALSGVGGERFLADRRAAGYRSHCSQLALRPLFAYLRAVGAVPLASEPVPEGPAEELVCRYCRSLACERKFVPAVVGQYARVARGFLARFEVFGRLNLERLTVAEITAFCIAHCRRQARGTAQGTVTKLRSFLRFLYVAEEIHGPLAEAVPSVAYWQATALPKALDSEQVHCLLASCDGITPQGLRDLAILTTLARLGLRACEVRRLLLKDIDWRAGEIVVRGKGKRDERMPLPTDVGEAIAAYLHRGRPSTAQGRTVFVRVRAPHRALSTAAVHAVVVSAARRAGLPRIGAHRLRHTVATAALRAGASLPEVGQLLRHRRVATTALYAKVDRGRLRTIVRPWPGGAR